MKCPCFKKGGNKEAFYGCKRLLITEKRRILLRVNGAPGLFLQQT